MLAIIEFLKKPVFKYGLAIVLVLGTLWYAYHRGQVNVQLKWDLEKEETAKEIAELKAKQSNTTRDVEIRYVTQKVEVKTKGDEIIRYVDRYITAAEDKNCILPNNFVLIHDLGVLNKTIPEEAKK